MTRRLCIYIHTAGDDDKFVGCGAYIEQNLIVTCRHVWRDAREQAKAVFPHVKRNGAAAISPLEMTDPCKATDGDDPDIVLLRAIDPPDGLIELQVARDGAYETGEASALARLPSRKTDHEIPGQLGKHVDEKGRRAFSQAIKSGYWLEKGSSGSPAFIGSGQQLAGIISMAELGDEPQDAPIREAYVVPGTIIWPFVRAVAERELGARERAIEQALLKEKEAEGARELVFEIARRSGADAATTFDQALPNAQAAFEQGRKAIEAGERGGNLGALVDDLLRKIAERTQAGDFAGGAAEADRAFAEWERIEAERREASVAAGVRIQSEGARQDILRRDFRAAAERYARIVELENPDASARFAALAAKQDEFYVEGRDKGANASLEVAIELARFELKAARDADEKGSAGNDLGNALWTLGERESGTARLEEAVAAYRAALEERTRERVPLDWAMTQNNLGAALQDARRAGERDGAARGGGRGLSRGAGGIDARAGSARLGDDAEQSRQCAQDARRAGERDGAARGGGRGLSRGAGGMDARAGSARLGDDAEQSRQCALDARRAGERDGAARGGGRGLSRGAGGMDARAGSARLGDDAEQSRQCASGRSASGRAGRRGSRRRSRPIARRWRSGRASGFRSTGR